MGGVNTGVKGLPEPGIEPWKVELPGDVASRLATVTPVFLRIII